MTPLLQTTRLFNGHTCTAPFWDTRRAQRMWWGSTDSVIEVLNLFHDDIIKWKHFPRYWTFVRGIHRSLVNSPHKGQWLGALMFSLICARINGWVSHREAGDLRRYHAPDVIVMFRVPLMQKFHQFPTTLGVYQTRQVCHHSEPTLDPNSWR